MLGVVQAVSAQSAGSATSVTSPGFNSTGGNLLVANAICNMLGLISGAAVTDSASNSWSTAVADQADATNDHFRQVYAANILSANGHTVTFTIPFSGFPTILVVEISGADTASPFDQSASHGGSSVGTNPHTTGTTPTTTGANEICVSGLTHGDANNNAMASVAGYTVQTHQDSTSNQPGVLATLLVSSTGAQADSYNLSPDNLCQWVSGVGTYLQAVAGPVDWAVEGHARSSPRN